jgi:hypothetical protein
MFFCLINVYPQDATRNIDSLYGELLQKPNDSKIYYSLMQYYASTNQRVNAAEWLEKLLRSGFTELDRIYTDSSLGSVIGYRNFINPLKESGRILKEREHIAKYTIKTKLETEYKYPFGKIEEIGKDKYLYKYSKNGTIAEKIQFDNNNKESWKWRYVYDKNNNVVEINEFNSLNKLYKSTKYKYDERYNLVNLKQTEGKSTNYVYEFTYGSHDNMLSGFCVGDRGKSDLKREIFGSGNDLIKVLIDPIGNVVEKTVFSGADQSKIKQKYITSTDSMGRILEIQEYNGDGKLQSSIKYSDTDESFYGGNKNKIYFVKYNSNNNISLKKQSSTGSDGRVALIITDEYDKFGNRTLEEYLQLLINGQPTPSPSFTRFIDKYDDRGNHLESIIETPQGPTSIIKNKYENELFVENYIYMKDNKTSIVQEYIRKFEYDSLGDIIREFDRNNKLNREYFYDTNKNLIEDIQYEGAQPSKSVKYVYTYYKEK